VPLPTFDGAPRREVHEHFDADGNVTGRTVVTVESEWTPEARAWALGLALREHVECRKCGGSLAETTDPGWAWEPDPPTVCFRCVALANAEKVQEGSPYRAGLIHHVRKKPKPKRRSRKKR